MERVEKMRDIVEKVLLEWAEFISPRVAPADETRTPEVIFDRKNDRYVLLDLGWKGNRRLHNLLVHIDIIANKIWIQEDNTETGVAKDLENYGILKSEIVLGFKSANLRKYTDYAVA
jgi:hypothetical protein